MSLSDDMVDDLNGLLNTDEFAVEAIFNSVDTINVIFDNSSVPVLDVDTGGIIMAGPQATCKSSDVPDAKGKTLKIDTVIYYIKEAQDDGTGVTILRLSRD